MSSQQQSLRYRYGVLGVSLDLGLLAETRMALSFSWRSFALVVRALYGIASFFALHSVSFLLPFPVRRTLRLWTRERARRHFAFLISKRNVRKPASARPV